MNLTGLLFTCGRETLLLAGLSAIEGYPFPVIILDASPEPARDLLRRIEGKSAIRYRHMPGCGTSQRFEAALRETETDYVVPLPDDDTLLPDQVARCLAFLEANPDYVAAQGSSWVGDDPERDNAYRLEMYSPSLDMEEPIRRLTFHARHYAHTLYSLQRRDAFAVCVANSRPLYEDPAFWELCMSFSLVGQGKLRCFPEPMLLRTPNSPESLHVRFRTNPALWREKDPEDYAAAVRRFFTEVSPRPPFAGLGPDALERTYQAYLATLEPSDNLVQKHKCYLYALSACVDGAVALDRLARMSPEERAPLAELEEPLSRRMAGSPLWRPARRVA